MTESVLDERKAFLKGMEFQLRLLEEDLLLQNEGIEILHVVDFAMIYSHMWKSNSPITLRLPGEPLEAIYARQQVALAFLFSGRVRNLLLIPPYGAELRNELRSLETSARLADLDVRTQVENLKRLIRKSPQFAHFLSAKSRVPTEVESHDSSVQKAAVELGKAYFPELYAVVSCDAVDGLASVRRLFEEHIVVDADVMVPELKGFGPQHAGTVADRWCQEIKQSREPERAFQTYIDALGCAYLEIGNRLIGGRRLILFVTRVKDVIGPLRRQSFESPITGLQFDPVRDLDYFWVGSVQDLNLGRVRESLRIVGDLLRVYESSAVQSEGIADWARRIIIESEPLWRQAENLLLLSDSLLLTSMPSVELRIEQSFLSWLNVMHQASTEEGAHEIEQQGMDLFAHIRRQVVELDRRLPSSRAIDDIRITKSTEGYKIRIEGLLDEPPTTIELASKAVIALAERLQHARAPKARSVLRERLMNWGGKPDEREARLLAAYILASDNRYDAALSELETVVGERTPSLKEALYLRAILYRKLFQPVEALDCISAAMEISSSDARFLTECGKIYWLRWQLNQDGSRDTTIVNLRTAVEYLERATLTLSSKDESRDLLPQIKNALAFIHCELALIGNGGPVNSEELVRAETYLGELIRLVPESGWVGRYHDTRAWILYARAMSTSDAARIRRAWLVDAKNSVERALQKETHVKARQHLLGQHLARIKAAIDALDRLSNVD